MTMDYKKAGVDVAAGDALVDWLSQTQSAKMPHQDKVVSGIGGFAALFRADFQGMTEPLLVSCTDGVGTKVKLAAEFGRYRSVAQDMVAMCVNDLICCGGQPLFFLDYYATGRLELKDAQEFLHGVREACIASECNLIGGETAEMPGVYQGKDFDCAGFAVGVVDRPKTLGPHKVKVGDQLVAVASSGFHSNGYSLLRKVFADDLQKWADTLLTPTALYVRLARELRTETDVHAFAHITGGGMDNIPRVLPKNTQAQLNPWQWPEPFQEVQKRTKMSDQQMLETLNCGVGLVVVVPESEVNSVITIAKNLGYSAWHFGSVHPAKDEESQWRVVSR